MTSVPFSKRLSRHEASLKARHALLLEGLADPSKVSALFKRSLISQRSFAGLSIKTASIAPMSLNTFKVQADRLFRDEAPTSLTGFGYLDSMRNDLSKLLGEKSEARTLAGKAARAADRETILNRKNLESMSQNAVLSKAFLELYGAFMTLLKSGMLDLPTARRIDNTLRDIWTMYGSLFGPGSNPDNATPINYLTIVPGERPEE